MTERIVFERPTAEYEVVFPDGEPIEIEWVPGTVIVNEGDLNDSKC